MVGIALPSVRPRPCGSMISGALPEGCRLCEEGAKMVLFVTGLCSYHCFYCPVSDEKMYKDVMFADEMRVERDEDVLAEARAIRAKGAGITGGDPMEAMDRLCHYLRLL
ncbi:MAG TPA: 4Fe-4S cluster-binding domain-containing protein, partial [Thermoplasmata archaeon]|nr:4Fe-4S cluster-binding domain-containing protein [Thermoplasmata archaeon]